MSWLPPTVVGSPTAAASQRTPGTCRLTARPGPAAPAGQPASAHVDVPDDWRRTATPVASLPLLSAGEEVELAHAIEAGVLAAERLELDEPVDEQLAADLRRLVALGRHAHDRMVLANVRLVHFWARRRLAAGAHGGLSLEDLVSEGTVGLLHGVQKFDYTLGFKFSTYTSVWIRERMQRAVARNTPAALDSQTQSDLARLYAAEEDLRAALHRTPTTSELAASLGTTSRHVLHLRQASRSAVSLDSTLPDRGGRPGSALGDLLVDDTQDSAAAAATADLAGQLRALLRQLPSRERRVLTLRFGLAGAPHTVEQTADLLGVSEAMVRDALQSALTRLRAAAGVDELHLFLEAA